MSVKLMLSGLLVTGTAGASSVGCYFQLKQTTSAVDTNNQGGDIGQGGGSSGPETSGASGPNVVSGEESSATPESTKGKESSFQTCIFGGWVCGGG